MAKPQLATLILLPSRFQISGPDELVHLTMLILRNNSHDMDETKYQVDQLWSNWYVVCSVSQTHIPLTDLRYWDVTKNEVYARPELVPNLYWHCDVDPRKKGTSK